jgi:RND family efflux transporter MFP subunit
MHMRYSTRTLSVVTVGVVLSFGAAGLYLRFAPDESDGDGVGAPAATGGEALSTSAGQQFSTDVPQPVTGSLATLDTLWITVTAAGQAAAVREATMTSRVEGRVVSVPVRENAPVRRDQGLVRIDTTEYAMEAAKAKSDVEDKQAEYQRMTLGDDGIEDATVRAQRDRLARVRSGLNQAEVTLRQAELDLERTTVRAPFGGRVADLLVVAGQWVTVGAELLTVVDLDPIKVEVQVLEGEIGLLAETRKAFVDFAAFPGEIFEGTIETINPKVDPDNRTARVTVLLSNPGGRIKPGMYAQVKIDAQAFPDRVLVERRAILERDGRKIVFVYHPDPDGGSGRAEWRYVTTGRENELLVELTRGDEKFVEPGEIVLVNGHHYLAHDAVVRLVDDPEGEGGRPGR